MQRRANWLQNLTYFFQREIWKPGVAVDRSARGRSYKLLRVASITFVGLRDSRATSRAAALSFSTLLGLGPLIGLVVLIASFALGKNSMDAMVGKLDHLIQFVAPQVSEFEQVNKSDEAAAAATAPTSANAKAAVNPKLIDLIKHFVAATRSRTGGVISIVSLVVIVLVLFTSVEQVFNDIWGVRRGRSWFLRIVFYWTILSLGAVLFFGAVGALSATTFIGYFQHHLPFGQELARGMSLALPVLSGVLIATILTLFYRYIPNTHVRWHAAAIGAVVAVLLLEANNLLAFLYFSRIDLTRSLYGSLGILPILMFGLYVFWLFIIVGGQISYAVQNVEFRNSQVAWSNLSESARETLTLAALVLIGRRFQACQPACTVAELSTELRAPAQILNESLNRLVDLRLVSQIPPGVGVSSSDYSYQPARPLDRMSLADFKHAFETVGEDPTADLLNVADPLVARYRAVVLGLNDQDLFKRPIDELFRAYPATAPAADQAGSK